jgi:hypothetical protein
MSRSVSRLISAAALIGALLACASLAAQDRSKRHSKAKAHASAHWAFVPTRRPPVPPVRNPQFPIRNPIDAFTLARLAGFRVRPASIADNETLVRRVYLDLIGLPPTPEERERFLGDRRPDAYERMVDELLARPQYGERWARHWLDVVRYAESNGYERDGDKPSAWRYRDYVVEAFNKDKPFDRFVVEQLAGDEVAGTNAESQIATTFLRLGTWDDEPAEPQADRYDQLDDVLGVTATAFLAQTLRCARCHDHKFEPFSQKEYYQVLAVFEPLKRPQKEREDLDRLVGTPADVKAYEESAESLDAEAAPFATARDGLKQTLSLRAIEAKRISVPNEVIGAIRVEPAKRSYEQRKLIAKESDRLDPAARAVATEQERQGLDVAEKRIAEIDKRRPKEQPRAYVWYEESPTAPKTHLLQRGDPNRKGEEVLPGVPAILCPKTTHSPGAPSPLMQSSGRRLWLANWIVRPDNPLTARVIANRVWQWHFGDGIVTTANDFGVMGQRPMDQSLLDWLATELVRTGWSLKKLNRFIVTSSTYRMSHRAHASAQKLDPDNHLLSRWPVRRVEAETYRDSVLSVSGRLNSKMGGPSVYPVLPRAVLEGQSIPGLNWGKSTEEESSRRSIYVFVKRSLGVPELEALDAPDTTSSCERRPVSTVAPQALTFLNGDFIRQQAAHFASRLIKEAGKESAARVRRAYRLALCREATPGELDEALRFLASQEKLITSELPGDRHSSAALSVREGAALSALKAFCLVLLNTNEFAYID